MAIDTADHLRDASPWKHEPDPIRLAVLGKLAEELGELQAAVARCIIQGADECHPVTQKPNLEWLFEEMADVCNMMNHVSLRFDFDTKAYGERIKRKDAHISQWLRALTQVNLP